MGYHQGWHHGYWNGNFGGGWGWRPYGYGYGLRRLGLWARRLRLRTWRRPGIGPGHGDGLGAFVVDVRPDAVQLGLLELLQPLLWRQVTARRQHGGRAAAAVYDYSQPIDPQTAPPDETVINQATTVFDNAREAFKAGDYAKALELVDQAIKTTPNDAALHEFRALCLFALSAIRRSGRRALCRACRSAPAGTGRP